jgi:hypothetical protein
VKKKNSYGDSTAPDCFFCQDFAISKNKQGLSVCKKHLDAKSEPGCPLCGDILDARNGRYGSYFFCWACNKNWSAKDIQKHERAK